MCRLTNHVCHGKKIEDTRLGIIPALHEVGAKLQEVIQENGAQNNTFCAMGVVQTLGMLHTIADSSIQSEIEAFTNNNELSSHLTDLNNQLTAHSKPIQSERDEKKKYILTNGAYALIAFNQTVNKSCLPKIKAVGAQLHAVDFCNATEAAAKINGIVKRDTNGKIEEILSASAFTPNAACVLLHTLYVNASFKETFAQGFMDFKDALGKRTEVKSLTSDEARLDLYKKKDTKIALFKTLGKCELFIRHSPTSVRLISMEDMKNFATKSKNVKLKKLQVPFISLQTTIDLKGKLSTHLPNTLNTTFQTELLSDPISVSDYIQKVTFDMTNSGVEASAATALLYQIESCMGHRKKAIETFVVDSPFTFLLTKTIAGQRVPLFHGQVINASVMKTEE
ncbi:serpin family protein [Candidatus Paracaedibacter symbiosus]|uniref:serpin family protein n=1 Tax=Candidatus Paracaedibacter symbiosus TaxID=244582 RepID=UPI0005093DDB|nr:serpin family protein [Candidatus Paracaedibacter symbiosus]